MRNVCNEALLRLIIYFQLVCHLIKCLGKILEITLSVVFVCLIFEVSSCKVLSYLTHFRKRLGDTSRSKEHGDKHNRKGKKH